MVPIGRRALVACRPFRNRTVGNSVVVVVVVGVVRVVVQRPDGVRRNPLLELFDLELSHVVPPFSSYPGVSRQAGRPPHWWSAATVSARRPPGVPRWPPVLTGRR